MSCEACRTIPPVHAKDYVKKGTYSQVGGLNTYVTGPTNAKVGLVTIFDVFGLVPQTLQGADVLAEALNAVVLVPDFFHGDSAQWSWFDKENAQIVNQKALMDFIATTASFEKNIPALLNVVAEAKSLYPTVEKWGSYGLCWGGKMVALTSGPDTPFTASGQVHPGLTEKADAEKITIPHIVLASKDEPAEAIADYKKIIDTGSIGGYVETYETVHHGWMAARADLEVEHERSEYTRGYNKLVEFFGKYLQ